MPEMTRELADQSLQMLREFADDMRRVAGMAPSPTLLAGALRTIADCAEVTGHRFGGADPADGSPREMDANDLMIIVLMAGYESGREGIDRAFNQIIEFDVEEKQGD